jgi:hypothetical protein
MLTACTKAEPPPAPAQGTTTAAVKPSVAAQDQSLYDGLTEALPEDPKKRETTCLARLVQARMLEKRTQDPRAQMRIRNARIECRAGLVEIWTDRAEPASGDPRAAACRASKAHLVVLQRLDGIEAAKWRPRFERVCPQPE